MWRGVLKNGSGGELDRVEALTEQDLKEQLSDKLLVDWDLSNGDRIEISAPD